MTPEVISYDQCCDISAASSACGGSPVESGCHNGDGGWSCCSISNQCGVGEGDCDNYDDCQDDLVCGTNNCIGSSFSYKSDCCVKK